MKNHEKSRKEIPGTKDKKNSKSKASTGDPEDILNIDSLRSFAADEGIPFLVNFSLKEGEIEGTITHCRTNTQMKFVGLDQAAIGQFMKRYLSRLEKSIEKMPAEEPTPQFFESVEVQGDEAKKTAAGEMRTRSLDVVPSGAAQPTDILLKGQPFQLQWSFEPPSLSGMAGEKMHYRIVICGKNLKGGERIKVGEVSGKIDFGSALTAHIPSGPLPPGPYRLEADSDFSMKSKIAPWHSACRERRLIQVI
jgi:hypothetical protein